MILGGVPVRVNKPPVLEPKAMGIKTLEGRLPAAHAAVTLTGKRAATVPVLLTNPESTPDPRLTKLCNFLAERPAQVTKRRPAIAVQPVLERPSPITNKPAIIITVGLLKPAKVSARLSSPLKKSNNMDSKATTSGVHLPQTKREMVKPRMKRTVVMIRARIRA